MKTQTLEVEMPDGSSALAPCPFCGEVECRPILATPGSPAWSVCCAMCNAVGPFDVDRAKAVRLWNHRANTTHQTFDGVPSPECTVSGCGCLRCTIESGRTVNGMPEEMTRIIGCEHCGNKRCPHASDHRNACSHINEPGQPGSVYE